MSQIHYEYTNVPQLHCTEGYFLISNDYFNCMHGRTLIHTHNNRDFQTIAIVIQM